MVNAVPCVPDPRHDLAQGEAGGFLETLLEASLDHAVGLLQVHPRRHMVGRGSLGCSLHQSERYAPSLDSGNDLT